MADVTLTVTLLDLNVNWAVSCWEEQMGTLDDPRNMTNDDPPVRKYASTKDHVETVLGQQLYRYLIAGHNSLQKKGQVAPKPQSEVISTG